MTDRSAIYRRQLQTCERDQLVLRYRPLVAHVLGRLLSDLPAHIDRENLAGAGCLGLVEAASRFDESRGVSFAEYARHRIRGAILDELRRNCPVPTAQLQLWSRIREHLAHAEVTPGIEELATRLKVSPTEIEDCLAAMRLLRPDEWQEELAPTCVRNQPAANLEQMEDQHALAAAITQLPERLQTVIVLYFGEDLRLKEIGELMHVSESRVSRLLSEALLKLRQLLTAEPSRKELRS